ncbi:MAG: transcription termination/antitermination protein NusG [Candidatus Krumholzibacteriia bacterium]
MFDDRQKNVEDLFPDRPEADQADDVDTAAEAAPAPVGADDLFLDLPDAAADEPADDAADVEAAAEPSLDLGLADEGIDEQSLLDAIEIEVSDEEQAEIERRSRLEWFALHANTGHENKVKRNIEMAIKSNHMEDFFGDVLVPIQEVTEMKNGKRVTTKKKFLPGYLLVEMLMTKETHHFVNSVPGVTGFIGGTPLKPQSVPRDEVDRILGRIKEPNDSKDILEIPYSVGDSVQVMDGPFTDWVGVINEINHEKGKLKVMISIFGKDTPVELDFLQVKQV